jgi:hypothetical protein
MAPTLARIPVPEEGAAIRWSRRSPCDVSRPGVVRWSRRSFHDRLETRALVRWSRRSFHDRLETPVPLVVVSRRAQNALLNHR